MWQQTIGARVEFEGVGVHGGQPVHMALLPAAEDTGIVFHRVDASGFRHEIAVSTWSAPAVDLATIVAAPSGVHVSTIEHIMAALYAMDVDNVVIEIDSDEVPIVDGCASAFVEGLAAVGTIAQAAKRQYIRVLKPVRVETASGFAEYRPYAGTRFEVEIDFSSRAVGRQAFAFDLSPKTFRKELSRARTFGFLADVEQLWAAGRALGSCLENSVVIGHDQTVINPEGLRYPDEFVRHKALDAVGDQALAGARVLGCYHSYRGGHKMNALALRALLSDSSAYELTERPARRAGGARHALPAAAAAPVFGPFTL
ncbi:UDP-3-O-acyl-N-acetylglucosamine deacetylase [Consotaella salsifontis]|uniref:UDP-3-O-acyl-N-acetylglucosamine deacetylase n=1 Tax=Consotaella salsifontis TaxID=1365950 RepID=A0A1T4M9U3_9HYPH|nr:UDP-3-O-acyl-N-acetylglucosamine deacetylase [Consotaella salsifontis]SJZ63558.1 UDP-3-O-[3-hydroxymyristoyl] N-acetylglucosamine deacetylase [Consotaella salsifontis]